MFTPETDHEKSELKMIAPGDSLIGTVKWGTFDNSKKDYMRENVEMCEGGYLRRFAQKDSLTFIIQEPNNDKK